MKVGAGRRVAPWTSQTITFGAFDGALIEDDALVTSLRIGCGDDGTRTDGTQGATFEEHRAIAIDEIDFTGNVAVLEVSCGIGLVEIIGVLHALQTHILVDGLFGTLAKGQCLSFGLAGIPVTSLTNGQILHIDVILVLIDEEHGRLVLVFGDSAGIVHKEHTLHAFADEGGVLHNFGERLGAEVVGAIEEEDAIALVEILALGSGIEGDEKFVDGMDSGIVRCTVFEDFVICTICLEVGKEIGIGGYRVFEGRILADKDFVLVGPSHEVVARVCFGCERDDSPFSINAPCRCERHCATFGRKSFGSYAILFGGGTAAPVATDGDLVEANLFGVAEAVDVDAEGKGKPPFRVVKRGYDGF